MSEEVSQRSYKGEILYEDPFLFDTDFSFKNRLAAFTFAYDGYSKFEIGDRVELSRKITKQYEAGLVFAVRHVEVTQTSLPAGFSAKRLISQIRSGSFKRSTCAKVRWSRRVAC